jgi:hypothetical protein
LPLSGGKAQKKGSFSAPHPHFSRSLHDKWSAMAVLLLKKQPARESP